MDSIKVVDTDKRVELVRGEGRSSGVVYVRRIKSTRREKIEAAGLVEGNVASVMRLGRLMMCSAIVGAESLTDADSGEAVAFTTQQHPTLGKIASNEVFDALGTDDLKRIQSAIDGAGGAGSLSEDQAGN